MCPCCSGSSYQDCCEPHHLGAVAATPSALMRARFCAFKLGLKDFLTISWHPSTRPSELVLHKATHWGRLQVHQEEPHNQRATVHFSAHFFEHGAWGRHTETSLFYQLNKAWYYHSGKPIITSYQPKRNEPCPCGSSNKYKHCCLKRA